MTGLSQQDVFKIKIIQFYEKVTKQHSTKGTCLRNIQQFIGNMQTKRAVSKVKISRKSTSIKCLHEPEKMAQSGLYDGRSPTKYSLKSNQSTKSKIKEIEKDCFESDWIYSSTQASKVVLFSLILSYFSNKYHAGITNIEIRINEYLLQNPRALNKLLVQPSVECWQKLKVIQTQVNVLRRQNRLLQAINKLPLQFTKLISKIIFGGDTNKQFTRKQMIRLSYEAEININAFSIFYRKIDIMPTIGDFKKSISLGYIKHSKTYVLANKIPQYPQSEIPSYSMNAKIYPNIKEVLDDYLKNDEILFESQTRNDLDTNTTQQHNVRQFINRRLTIVNNK